MSNAELLAIFQADQHDREQPLPIPSVAADARWHRDEARLARVRELDAAGGIVDADDCWHAAMVYHHAPALAGDDDVTDLERARALARRAVALEPAHRKARWLVCAIEDRISRRRGLPQRWGTQLSVDADGVWTLDPVDDSVDDAERARQGLPSLAEQRARAERESRTRR